MNAGDIYYCKLTGKKLIIQRIFYAINENPMLVNPEKIIDKILVRYWSKPQDKYYSHTMYEEELTTEKPIYNPANYGKPLYPNKKEEILTR